MTDFKQQLWEAIKEPLRLLIMAGISFLLDYGIANVFRLPLDPNLIAIVTLLLRGADKFWHERQKNLLASGETMTGWKGLIGF